MPLLPLRALPTRPRATLFDAWLEQLAADLDGPEADWALVCRRTLTALS